MRLASCVGVMATAWCACSAPEGPPYGPARALASFEIHPEFEIELYLAEPDVVDPVAMAFGADRRIWVVENSGYPLDVQGRRGRIKLLEDTDGDLRPDRTTVFADQLTMPTGVMAWKKGVIVTDAPDVLYLEDQDGDGIADVRETLLTGFAFTNPQHTVSSPVYGLDNWIYLSHEGHTQARVFVDQFADEGSEIHFPARPDGPRVPVERRSVRFRPDTFELELLAGPSQFGLAFSEFGDVFTHNNTYHARHEVIASRYLERNPRLRVERTAQNVYIDPEPALVYPITRDPRFEMLSGVGRMTSASGLTRYLGGAFPGHEDLAVVAEPTHNLVHADRWRRDGVAFIAEPLLRGREFLASRDSWFRPVNFTIGPDGALYVIDYYRGVIEHPEWTSVQTYEDPELLYGGDDRGRVWRLTPKGGLPDRLADLSAASDAELAELLSSTNIWDRRNAQRLLVERGTGVRAGSADPVGRVHELWTLDGLERLADSDILDALQSDSAGVRKNAVQLAEPRFREDPDTWGPRLLRLAEDRDAAVRLQALLTLGEARGDASAQRRLLTSELEDEWFQLAALSWPETDALALLAQVQGRVEDTPAGRRLLSSLAAMAAEAGPLLTTARGLPAPRLQAAILDGLDEGSGDVVAFLESEDPEVRRAALRLLARSDGFTPPAEALDRARGLALDRGIDDERRADAIALLAVSDEPSEWFRRLLDPSEPEAVQAAAVRGYARAPDAGEVLLERWRELPAQARLAAGEALVSDQRRAERLVAAIEEETVQPWSLEFRVRRRLMMHSDPVLRERARAALERSERERRQIVVRYREALAERPGDASKGRAVFERVCKECHRLNGRGVEVGPDLATVSTRPAVALLNDILMPNASIAQLYEAWVVETTDGEILDGVIGEQTPTSVTLRSEGGQERVVARSEIRSMRAAQLSAMPQDLETQISPMQMADLIRYIQTTASESGRRL